MIITANVGHVGGKFAQRRLDRRPVPHPSIAGAALVALTRGRFALIDECDSDAVGERLWHLGGGKGVKYAATTTESGTLHLHRFIWERMGGAETPQVDHRDRDGLNCRRGNLRAATSSQNRRNSKVRADSNTGLKGVTKSPFGWRSRIRVDGKEIVLGMFPTAEEAHAAYVTRATEVAGEFARAS
jgi:hypothetical protein